MFNHQELINTMGVSGHKKFLKDFMKDKHNYYRENKAYQ